jgi:DNA integrity scanning protein DisA with diadenylate cyclase activity
MFENIVEILKAGLVSFLDKVSDFYSQVQGSIGWSAVIDVFITTLILWALFSIFDGPKIRRTAWLVFILVILYVSSQIFDLVLLNLVLKYLAIIVVVSIPVVFHKEIQEYFDETPKQHKPKE